MHEEFRLQFEAEQCHLLLTHLIINRVPQDGRIGGEPEAFLDRIPNSRRRKVPIVVLGYVGGLLGMQSVRIALESFETIIVVHDELRFEGGRSFEYSRLASTLE